MSQNYLLVYCENKKLYIYDMAIQALERIIEAKKVNKYINKELNNHDSLKIKKSDLSISKFDENLLNYLNQNFQPGPQN